MSVLMSDKFNERFTLYLNAEGKPVERTLREMTADEVMTAIEWLDDEAARLERESAPFTGIVRSIEAVKCHPKSRGNP